MQSPFLRSVTHLPKVFCLQLNLQTQLLSCPHRACLNKVNAPIRRHFLLSLFAFCGVCGAAFPLKQCLKIPSSLDHSKLACQHCSETTLTQNKSLSDSMCNLYFAEYFTYLKYMPGEEREREGKLSLLACENVRLC